MGLVPLRRRRRFRRPHRVRRCSSRTTTRRWPRSAAGATSFGTDLPTAHGPAQPAGHRARDHRAGRPTSPCSTPAGSPTPRPAPRRCCSARPAPARPRWRGPSAPPSSTCPTRPPPSPPTGCSSPTRSRCRSSPTPASALKEQVSPGELGLRPITPRGPTRCGRWCSCSRVPDHEGEVGSSRSAPSTPCPSWCPRPRTPGRSTGRCTTWPAWSHHVGGVRRVTYRESARARARRTRAAGAGVVMRARRRPVLDEYAEDGQVAVFSEGGMVVVLSELAGVAWESSATTGRRPTTLAARAGGGVRRAAGGRTRPSR